MVYVGLWTPDIRGIIVIVDGRRRLAGEQKVTGQRLLTAHAHASVFCWYTYTVVEHWVCKTLNSSWMRIPVFYKSKFSLVFFIESMTTA